MQKIDLRKSIYFLAFGIGLISLVVAVQIAKADAWSWTSGTPTIVSKENANLNMSWVSDCESRYNSPNLTLPVEGTGAPYEVNSNCLVANDGNFKLLSYASNQSLAIQFEGDKNAHSIRGADCRQCVYLPSRDMLINVERGNTAMTGKVAVYKNFVSKLRLKNTLSLNQKYYELDQTAPDQYIGNTNNIVSKHIGRSQNDKWVVVEVVGSGFFRINMDTMEMLKFSSSRTNYGYASPVVELDITNDGQHIAVAGEYDNAIYDITPGCGYNISDAINVTENQVNQPQQTYCPYAPITSMTGGSNNDNILYGMSNIDQLYFSDDGGEITFYARNLQFYKAPIKVTLRANGYTGTQPLDYLALGDSYSSGEGDIDPKGVNYYRSFTDIKGNKERGIPEEKCHVSTRSYPYKLAATMGLTLNNPKQWDTVTCSGARITDINSEGLKSYLGQYDRLKGYNVDALKTQGLNEFIPGRAKQIEFVTKYKPKVITLTIGGNDVDFINKLKPCAFSPDTCAYATNRKADLASGIYSQYYDLQSLYKELYEASGKKAKIYVIGYPNFINGNDNALCGVNIGFLNASERSMIQNSVTYLNNVIKKAAQSVGVKYIDIENSLNGHRLCDSGEKYMNAATVGLTADGLSDFGSFHPNAKGHQAIFDNILSTQNLNHVSLLDYDACPDTSDNICPNADVTQTSIEIPTYFSEVTSNKNTHYKQVTEFEQIIGKVVDISLGLYTFAANSIVSIKGYSEPTDLGSFVVPANGSLNANFVANSTMGVGFHTIVVSGTSFSGDPVEYEQVILVKGSNLNDVDADGVIDTLDRCLFIQPVNKDIDGDNIDDACDSVIGDIPVTVPTPSPTPSASPSPSSTPKPSPVSTPTILAIVTQIINVIISIISLLASLLKKIVLRL